MYLRVFLLAFSIVFVGFSSSFAAGVGRLQTLAKGAILLDYDSGKVLYEKNIDKRIYPASTVKIMTSYIAFESIEKNQANLQDIITVSKNAFTKGGFNTGSSTMFLQRGEQITLEQAIRGMIVQSGNDATIAIAEHLKGSEEDFANYMNQVAYRLNLEGTNFVNSTGWPDKNQYTTLSDITTITRHLITEYPKYYHYFSEKSFQHNGISQNNRNSLLFMDDIQVDGVKTGHTQDSGYVLVFSGIANGFRYIGAVYGLDSSRARTLESRKIVKWVENNLTSKTIYQKGEKITDISVWNSKNTKVEVKAPYDIKIVYPKSLKEGDIKVNVRYKDNIASPIAKDSVAVAINVEIQGAKNAELYNTTHEIYFTEDIEKNMPFWQKFFYTPLYVTKTLIHRFK